MKRGILMIVLLSALLSGCGSFLAAVDSGPIEENPGERTLAQRIEDESIETKAIVNIRTSDDGYDGANLQVVSFNGYVLVTGQVATQTLKDKVGVTLRSIDGVRRIYNQLDVGPVTTVKVRTSDAWLTTQVKSALLFRSDTPGSRIKVTTENGVVYLMGLVSREEADRATAVARGIEKVTRVEQLFELITPISLL